MIERFIAQKRDLTSAQFKALADAATPGPWTIPVTEGDTAFIAACGTHRERIYKALLLMEMVEGDAEAYHRGDFETSARMHLCRHAAPRLLARVEAEAQL